MTSQIVRAMRTLIAIGVGSTLQSGRVEAGAAATAAYYAEMQKQAAEQVKQLENIRPEDIKPVNGGDALDGKKAVRSVEGITSNKKKIVEKHAAKRSALKSRQENVMDIKMQAGSTVTSPRTSAANEKTVEKPEQVAPDKGKEMSFDGY